jgi:RNA polymerase sigma factor (sigma-70 family)
MPAGKSKTRAPGPEQETVAAVEHGSETRSERNERLLVQAAQKDRTRFADLYEENFERVFAFVIRRVRNREIAEDITSDVFHRALAGLPKFDWRGIPFRAWLIRIAANLIADQWKRIAREGLRSSEEDAPESPSQLDLEEAEHRARLFRLVERLPADQCQVLQLRFAEGRSLAETAQAIGRSEGAIKQLQFRALAKLRSQLHGRRGTNHG